MKINKLKTIALQLSVFALILFSANFANAEEAKESKNLKIAIIGPESELAKEIDLLTVEFSKDTNFSVLSRSEWTKLIREYEILKQDTASAYSKFGNISGADALVILNKQKLQNKKYLLCKLITTKTGLILDTLILPYPLVSKELNWIGGVKKRFSRKLAKLATAENHLQTVSLLNIRAERSSPELLKLEKQINAVFAYRLKRNENILVTERDNMPEVLFEKYLNNGDESEFKTGSAVVDGSFTLVGDKIKFSLRIKKSNANSETVQISADKTKIAELAEKLEKQTLRSIAQKQSQKKQWDIKKEALEYTKEAEWAFNYELYDIAAKASEAAWALGMRGPEIIRLRILSYSQKAFKYSIKYNESILSRPHPDVKHSTIPVNSAIIAMELIKHHIIEPHRKKGKVKYFRIAPYKTSDVFPPLYAASFVLHAYSLQDCYDKDLNKRIYLRKLIREFMDTLLDSQNSLNSFATLLFEFIPVYYDTIKEMKEAYKRTIIRLVQGNAGTGCACLDLRWFTSKVHSKTPYFIDWKHGKKSKEMNKVTADFIEELIASDIPLFHLNGLILKYYNKKLFPNLKTSEILKEIKTYILKNKALVYQGKLWWEGSFLNEESYKFLMGYPQYLIDHPTTTQRINIYPLFWPNGYIHFNNYSDEQLRKIYAKIVEWDKVRPKSQINKNFNNFASLKSAILKRIPELETKVKGILYLKKFWTPYSHNATYKNMHFFSIVDHKIFQNKLYVLISLLVNNRTYSYYIYVFNNKLNLLNKISIPAEEDDRLAGHFYSYLTVNKKLIAVRFSHKIMLYEIENASWRSIDFPDLFIEYYSILDKHIYISYSNNNEFGLMKMDLSGENRILISSSRRKPPKTPLDNLPTGYGNGINSLIPLDNDLIFIELEKKYKPFIHLLNYKKELFLKESESEVYKKYLVAIYKTRNTYKPYYLKIKDKKGEWFLFRLKNLKNPAIPEKLKKSMIQIPANYIHSIIHLKGKKTQIFFTSNGFFLINDKYPEGILIPYSKNQIVHDINKQISAICKDELRCSINLHMIGIINDTLLFSSSKALLAIEMDELEKCAGERTIEK
jgi:hypothetical protein